MSRKGCSSFLLAIIIAISAFTILPTQVYADGDEVTMSVEVGFDGYFNMAKWTPVIVDIENKGADIEGWLEADAIQQDDTAAAFSTKAVIPKDSKKRITLYVQFSTVQHDMDVRLTQKDKTIKQVKVKDLYAGYDKYLIGVLTDDKEALNYWWQKPGNNGLFTNHETVHLNAQNFPDRKEVLDNFTVLVINDFDTGMLSQKQIGALNAWIDGGGLLIIGTGPNGQKTLNGLTDKVIALRAGEVKSVDKAPALDALAGVKNYSDIPFQLMNIDMEDAGDMVKDGENRVIAELRRGAGYIFVSAFDLGLEPITGWAGNQAIWDNLLKKRLDQQETTYMRQPTLKLSAEQGRYSGILQALGNIKAMDIPSINGLMILLLIYIAAAGPISYVILKRLDKREWMWLTVPLLVLIFSGGIYATGYTVKGDDVISNTISVINVKGDGSVADIDKYLGIFIPNKGDYTISSDNGALFAISSDGNFYDSYTNSYMPPPNAQNKPRPIQAKFVQGEPSYIELYNASVWTMKTFSMEEAAPKLGSFKADLYYEGGEVSGVITNVLPYPVEDMIIFTPYGYQIIGNMASGEAKEVSIKIPPIITSAQVVFNDALNMLYPDISGGGNPGGLTDEQREATVKRDILWNIVMPDDLTRNAQPMLPTKPLAPDVTVDDGFLKVAAFTDQKAAGDIKVNGRLPAEAYHMGVITGDLNVDFESHGTVSVPPGVIKPAVEIGSRGNSFVDKDGSVYVSGERVTVAFDISRFKDVNINKIRISVPTTSPAPGTAIKLSIYDNDKGDYVESGPGLSVDNKAGSANVEEGVIEIEGDDIGRFISADGVIKVAVDATSDVTLNFAIAIEGRER